MKRYDWVNPQYINRDPWAARHLTAIHNPRSAPASSEEAIVKMLRAWIDYAHSHKARFESEIGQTKATREDTYHHEHATYTSEPSRRIHQTSLY